MTYESVALSAAAVTIHLPGAIKPPCQHRKYTMSDDSVTERLAAANAAVAAMQAEHASQRFPISQELERLKCAQEAQLFPLMQTLASLRLEYSAWCTARSAKKAIAPDMGALAARLESEAGIRSQGRSWGCWTVSYPSGANRQVRDALEAAGKAITASKQPGVTRVFVTYMDGHRNFVGGRVLIHTMGDES